MTAIPTPPCDRGVAPATLSHWRDGALAPDAARALERHAATCAACRARLAEYDSIGSALRAIAVPEPVGGYGHTPRPAAPAWRPSAWRPSAWRRPSIRLPRLTSLGGLGAAAAAVLLIALFAQLLSLFGRPTGVTWQSRQPLPGHIDLTYPTGDFAIAPSDGATAYACAFGGGGDARTLDVWVTRDSASHWSPPTTLPSPAGATGCLVVVDANDPAVAVLESALAPGTAESVDALATYTTSDGGRTWRRLGATPTIRALASARGSTYAILDDANAAPAGSTARGILAVSRDGGRGWTPVAGPGPASGTLTVRAFWLDPRSGGLLAETTDLGTGDERLWSSPDGGATWTATGPSLLGGTFVVWTVPGRPWQACAAAYDPSGGPAANALTRTTDGGRTWRALPALDIVATVAASGSGHGTSTASRSLILALAADGGVLAAVDGTGGGAPTLYRLPAGASRWETLGAAPERLILYAAAPGHGILWAVPSGGTAPGSSAEERIYTAAYP